MAEVMGNPGKYDDVTERALEETGAECVALIVINGKKGTGFSVSGNGMAAMENVRSGRLSALLRLMAEQIASARPDGVRATFKK